MNATTGVYTVPVSGKYRISASLFSTNIARVATANKYATIGVSGTKTIDLYTFSLWASATNYISLSGSTTTSYNAGDTISMSMINSLTETFTLIGTAADNWICIDKVGN